MGLFSSLRGLAGELREPDIIVASYLSSMEEVYYDDPPAFQAFLLFNVGEIALVVALLGIDLFFWFSGNRTLFLLTFIAIDLLVIGLIVERFRELFTRYVLTSFRVMRVTGVLNRTATSIPWAKVTDLTFTQTLWMRYLGYANVRIESANEAASGLQELKGLKNPVQFHRMMLEMVASKQGHTAPESGAIPIQKFEAGSRLRTLASRMPNQPRVAPPPRPARPPRHLRGRRVSIPVDRSASDDGNVSVDTGGGDVTLDD